MPKRILKKYFPDPEKLKQQKNLQFLGSRLHEPNLWFLNRTSVSTAFAIGLLVAWVPSPGQMVIAAVFALYLRANLAISVALVWITNPLTMPPMFYFAYVIGLQLLGRTLPAADFNFSVDEILAGMSEIWEPFLLGCLVLGIISASIGYIGIRLFWRYSIIKRWKNRKKST